jgi:hypothetical protein
VRFVTLGKRLDVRIGFPSGARGESAQDSGRRELDACELDGDITRRLCPVSGGHRGLAADVVHSALDPRVRTSTA